MGTPVPYRPREEQCKGAGECIPRQMTEEERQYYSKFGPLKKKPTPAVMFEDINNKKEMEVDEMKKEGRKITLPERAELVKVLNEVMGKTRSITNAGKKYSVSGPTIYEWIKQYKLSYGLGGWEASKETEVHKAETAGTTMQAAEQETCSGTPETDTHEFDNVPPKDPDEKKSDKCPTGQADPESGTKELPTAEEIMDEIGSILKDQPVTGTEYKATTLEEIADAVDRIATASKAAKILKPKQVIFSDDKIFDIRRERKDLVIAQSEAWDTDSYVSEVSVEFTDLPAMAAALLEIHKMMIEEGII